MPLDILNKPGKLTDAEFDVMRSHPVRGHELLQEARGADPAAMDVCLHHHERFDGGGYPHKLPNDQLNQLVRMGSICDVYDAITSNRPYKIGWDPADSIGKMASWKGQFDPVVFATFVKSVGIYPTGSLVRLHSDRLARGDRAERRRADGAGGARVLFAEVADARVAAAAQTCRRGTSDRIVGARVAGKVEIHVPRRAGPGTREALSFNGAALSSQPRMSSSTVCSMPRKPCGDCALQSDLRSPPPCELATAMKSKPFIAASWRALSNGETWQPVACSLETTSTRAPGCRPTPCRTGRAARGSPASRAGRGHHEGVGQVGAALEQVATVIVPRLVPTSAIFTPG